MHKYESQPRIGLRKSVTTHSKVPHIMIDMKVNTVTFLLDQWFLFKFALLCHVS